MGQLLAFGIVHQEGGLAPQVARPPPWLSTPVAMLPVLAAGNHPVMPRARPYKPPTPSAYAPTCWKPMSKLLCDHPPKSVCTLSFNTIWYGGSRDVGTAPSSLGRSPLLLVPSG